MSWIGARQAHLKSTMSIPPVTIRCNEGLVTIPSLNGEELKTDCQLWNDITASEYLPAAHSAFYILTVSKPESDHKAVDATLKELERALDLLSRCWIFACGFPMSTTAYEVVVPSKFEHNVEEVRKAILRQKGLVGVGGSARVNFEVIATYPQPPLKTASEIAIALNADPALAKLLEYYNNAHVNYYRAGGKKASWFIDLYKVRDFFDEHFGTADQARKALNMSNSEWAFIGKILNNHDYRHADTTGIAPKASQADIEKLFQSSRQAVIAFLESRGLNPWKGAANVSSP